MPSQLPDLGCAQPARRSRDVFEDPDRLWRFAGRGRREGAEERRSIYQGSKKGRCFVSGRGPADHAVVESKPLFCPSSLDLTTTIHPLAHYLPSPSHSSPTRLSRLAALLESCYFLWLLSTQQPLFIILPSVVSSSFLAPVSSQSSFMAPLITVSILLPPSPISASR